MTDYFAQLLVENVEPRRGQGWHGGPTPLGAVRGVSAAQAAWAPFPGRKSIWQLTLHVGYWKYAIRRRLEGGAEPRFPRQPANWPRVPEIVSPAAWRADVALLRSEHDQLLDAIAGIPSKRYGEILPGGKRWTIGELILGIAQHDAYHAGQLQMLKRLWHASNPGS